MAKQMDLDRRAFGRCATFTKTRMLSRSAIRFSNIGNQIAEFPTLSGGAHAPTIQCI